MMVCWSGGCDSTLLLHDLAREHGLIRALSVNHGQVPRAEESKAARSALAKRLRGRGLKIEHAEMDMATEGDFACLPGGGLTQPLLWLASAACHLEEAEDLYLGYIKGDCVWHYKAELVGAFNALQAIRGHCGVLKLPMEWMTKADVIRQLQKLRLYDACWWCEKVIDGKRLNRPCGKCPSCITHRTALWQLRHGLAA